jgi:hypothetical protein
MHSQAIDASREQEVAALEAVIRSGNQVRVAFCTHSASLPAGDARVLTRRTFL